jgi:hypothetical protein
VAWRRELVRSAIEIVKRLVLIYYNRRGGFGSSVIDGIDSWPPNSILEELEENRDEKGAIPNFVHI